MIIEIMFTDLEKSKQQELLRAYNIPDPSEANWEVVPVTLIDVAQESNYDS